ncbi:hypothetical protein [Emticicia sp.]|uniref:hypothetical protein n=1 Tax=Emticicia sp. TaxID=1930953 RepID=UPI0037506D1E
MQNNISNFFWESLVVFSGMEFISLRDALRLIDAVDGGGFAQINHLVFVTADRRRRTGGKVIEMKKAVVNKPRLTKAQITNYDTKKNENLVQTERLRRIREYHGTQVISIHVDLLLMINGKGVL